MYEHRDKMMIIQKDLLSLHCFHVIIWCFCHFFFACYFINLLLFYCFHVIYNSLIYTACMLFYNYSQIILF